MSRSLVIGCTDYSRQTLNDMIEDMKNWVEDIENTTSFFLENITTLNQKQYWEQNVDFDFKIAIDQSLQLFKTSTTELIEIISELVGEIRKDHATRAIALGKSADEIWNKYGIIWHQKYSNKDYGNPNFRLVENLYTRGRDMLGDMIDLCNLGERLKDFEGKKEENIIDLNPNFYGIGINVRALYKKIKKMTAANSGIS